MPNKIIPTASIAQRSRHWLTAIAKINTCDEEYVVDLVLSVIGVYLCDVLEGVRSHPASIRMCCHLSEHIAEQNNVVTLAAYAPAKVLLARSVSSRYGVAPDAFEHLTRAIADTFIKIDTPLSGEQILTLLLLYRFGLRPLPPPLGSVTQADVSGGALEVLLAQEDDLQRICDRINSASLFGSVSVEGDPETLDQLATALTPVMLQRLRIYDLELGALLLRVLAYLHLDGEELVQAGLRFLEAQQRADGAFGYFALNTESTGTHVDGIAVRRIYLSITLACLWTIAELRNPSFRLSAEVL